MTIGPASTSERQRFLHPERLMSRGDVLTTPCPVPAVAGVYGWWFDVAPGDLDISRCVKHRGLRLLYTGISPQPPPRNGRAPSRSTLRARIRTHYNGNAEGSTLRKTLGCLSRRNWASSSAGSDPAPDGPSASASSNCPNGWPPTRSWRRCRGQNPGISRTSSSPRWTFHSTSGATPTTRRTRR